MTRGSVTLWALRAGRAAVGGADVGKPGVGLRPLAGVRNPLPDIHPGRKAPSIWELVRNPGLYNFPSFFPVLQQLKERMGKAYPARIVRYT